MVAENGIYLLSEAPFITNTLNYNNNNNLGNTQGN
jgi:hypothetical protein